MGNRFLFAGYDKRPGALISGFTLLEVLVALLIMGVSLGVVFQAFSQSKRISWKSEEKMECGRIAQNILNNSAIIGSALKQEKMDGLVKGEEGWHYTITVHPLEIESEEETTRITHQSMVDLKLVLVHDTGQRERHFEISRWYRFPHEGTE